MTTLDWALLCLLSGIVLLVSAVLLQMYVMLTETYTLDRFSNTPQMKWVAVALFFSFSLAVYWACPNARKKGVVFFILGGGGVILYGLGMYLKKIAFA